MAIIKNGIMGNLSGRMGDLTFYIRNGKTVVRKRYKIQKPPSVRQLKNRREMAVSMAFLTAVLEFINVGFVEVTKGLSRSPYNEAVSYNKKHAMMGEYPDIKVNYPMVLLSKGRLPDAMDAGVEIVDGGIQFSWAMHPAIWPHDTDQVMMLAYFPVLETAIYTLAGAMRKACMDVLPIPEDLLEEQMEVYISFVSSDRKRNADSTYLGSFNKGQQLVFDR